MVMDTYALEKLTGWTPELSPPPDSPLYRWRVLAGEVGTLPLSVAVLAESDLPGLTHSMSSATAGSSLLRQGERRISLISLFLHEINASSCKQHDDVLQSDTQKGHRL
jgi:hypothetical protein